MRLGGTGPDWGVRSELRTGLLGVPRAGGDGRSGMGKAVIVGVDGILDLMLDLDGLAWSVVVIFFFFFLV